MLVKHDRRYIVMMRKDKYTKEQFKQFKLAVEDLNLTRNLRPKSGTPTHTTYNILLTFYLVSFFIKLFTAENISWAAFPCLRMNRIERTLVNLSLALWILQDLMKSLQENFSPVEVKSLLLPEGGEDFQSNMARFQRMKRVQNSSQDACSAKC